MTKRLEWSPERCERAIAVLRRCSTIEAACAILSGEMGGEVTTRALQGALSRHTDTTWGTNLGVDIAAEALTSQMVEAPKTERMLPLAQVHELPDDSETTAPAEPMSDPEMSRAEMVEHRLRRQVVDGEAARQRLLKDLADREEQIQILKELRAQKPLGPIEAHSSVGCTQRQGVPLMMCSDWHIEEPVFPAKVNGLNEYNLEIADRCIDRMADAYEWMLRDARYDCRTGVVWLGGDLLSGYIHEELVEANFLSPVQAVVWLQERIERMLRKIAATTTLERIIVPCTDGNHGRITNKTRVSTRTANSIEWLLYQTLAARLADEPRFEFQVADGEWSFLDIYDQTVAFTHGDTFRYQGGVGGISIPLRRGINEMRKYRRITQTCLGHFHQRCDFGDINVNGSAIGVNTYSMHIHAPPEPRQQSWFMIDSKRGKALSAPIWL